jgi:hypothetical protein
MEKNYLLFYAMVNKGIFRAHLVNKNIIIQLFFFFYM